jgi:hypothetical protein
MNTSNTTITSDLTVNNPRRIEDTIHTLETYFPKSVVMCDIKKKNWRMSDIKKKNWIKKEYIIYSGEDNSLLVCFSFKFVHRNEPVRMSYDAVIACCKADNVLTIKRATGFFQNNTEKNQDKWFYENDIVSTHSTTHAFQQNCYNELIRLFPNNTIVTDCQNDRIEKSTFYEIITWMSTISEKIRAN